MPSLNMLYVKAFLLALVLAYVGALNLKIHNLRSHITREADREAAATGRALASIARIQDAHAVEIAAIDQRITTEKAHATAHFQAVIDGLHAGTRKLRDHFTCPAVHGPASAGGTGGSDAAAPGGFSVEDGDFLVRFAHEADGVALDLQACQALVRADRQVCP